MDMSQYGSKVDTRFDYLVQHNAVAWRHLESLYAIKKFIRLGVYDVAHESWEEIPHEDQIILNRAKSKGGFFEPFERQIAVRGTDAGTGWSYRSD